MVRDELRLTIGGISSGAVTGCDECWDALAIEIGCKGVDDFAFTKCPLVVSPSLTDMVGVGKGGSGESFINTRGET